MQRDVYAYQLDQGPGHPGLDGDEDFRLPAHAAMLPSGEEFGLEKTTRLALHKAALKLRAPWSSWRLLGQRMDTEDDYLRTLGGLRRSHAVTAWKSDEEFGRQRLCGTNPMSLTHCDDLPEGEVASAAESVLDTLYRTSLRKGHSRLFRTSYPLVLHPAVQSQVAHGATLPGAECFFYATEHGSLMPIAIELTSAAGARCVVTPLDERPRWLLAKAHANSADTHYHEGVFHLLETHMVSELFALATHRHLHPDHPLHQLLDPHFEHNLAIDHLARNNLLSPGGPIDLSMSGGVGGTLDIARLWWKDWSFGKRRFTNEISARGIDDTKVFEVFPYRDDGLKLYSAIESYARGVLRIWYGSNEDIVADTELAAWIDELSKQVPGLPNALNTTGQLFSLVADIIFRASVQHSAVNNGQFDSYGFVPNSPGSVYAEIPRQELSAGLEEKDVLSAMPRRKGSNAQLGMCWVLSQPTHRSLYASGESPAFSRELCRGAYEEVQAFREQLRHISRSIEERNRSLSIPYTYLNPHNIGRSIAI